MSLPDAAASAAPAARPPARFTTLRHRLRLVRARVRARGRLSVEGRPFLGRGVRLEVHPGARVVLGDGCSVGDGSRVHAFAGTVEIGPGAVLGERCVVVCHAGVAVGRGCLLGDGVVLLDFSHVIADVERPIRVQGLEATPVAIAPGARLGHGAAVLRGVNVGPGAAVGARSVVTHDVPAGAVVGGVPARGARRRRAYTENHDE